MRRPRMQGRPSREAGSAEEERTLWRRFRAAKTPELRETLIRRHIGLVRSVAGRLALRLPRHVSVDDLEGAGIPGLLAAVEAYDPEKDVDFAAYAQARIRGAILDELRALDPLPRSLRDKAKEIERAVLRLQQRLLRAPSDEEIAEALGIPLEVLHRVRHDLRGGLQVSLDAAWPGTDEDGDAEGGGPPEPEGSVPDPWQALALKERRTVLAGLIEQLPQNERTVLSLYHYEELTMKEIGSVLEVSESRVSQIHSAALLRIRNQLRGRELKQEDLRVDDERSARPSGLARATA